MELRYLPHAHVEDLAVGDCTVHRASDGANRWWLLWFRIERETDGQPEDVAVPIAPNGPFNPDAPFGKVWGFNLTAPGRWVVSPSIDVKAGAVPHPGGAPGASIWHQTPTIVGVPDGEPWIAGAP